MKERLQKILSAHGICSRRSAEKLIADGRVKVNGLTASLGDSADDESDEILLDGRAILRKDNCVYIMLNKPQGYVTTLSDEAGRPDVSELIKSVGRRVFPVGRLDMHSEGLLLLTDDGALANALTHPSHEVYKQYLVKISWNNSAPAPENPASVLEQITKLDGQPVAPAKCELLSSDEQKYVLTISIREGKNRQIRRMCASLGYTVNSLKRVAVGDVKLAGLPAGEWRYLRDDEVKYLKSL